MSFNSNNHAGKYFIQNQGREQDLLKKENRIWCYKRIKGELNEIKWGGEEQGGERQLPRKAF